MDKLRFPGLHNIYLTITTIMFIYLFYFFGYLLSYKYDWSYTYKQRTDWELMTLKPKRCM